MQLELIPDLDTEAIDFEMEPQDAMQRRYNLLKDQFAPRVAALLLRLNLPETMPDHVLFLMEPAANPASSVIHSELETRLRRKAQVVSVMGAADGWSIGQGVTYFGGSVFSNAIAVVRLSGSLPLQPDHLTPMRLALARLSNAPPGLNLAELQSRPPLRILSGEAINPVRLLAFSFGPHPMQEVVRFFGEKGIHLLQQADKLEVFRISTTRWDAPQPSGPKTTEGYNLVKVGRALDAKSARRLADALLGEQQGLRVGSRCGFDPAVIFQIWRGKEFARLVVCFTCNECTLAFYDSDGKLTRRNSRFHFRERSTLLDLARQALPGDVDLEKL